ncbi:MAG: 4Fe-4S binding protein [Helicobacter sp.]|uniref:4Fe-4S binding protein n=1 Tax=Helicobacter sp. TaxID=218 RepID=UPI0025BB55F6|nr:4Fe-4S binding protein [Helicobacter sp.]MCH5312971.1 4Fe-4S binding protein [Helicobacter sp.]
MQEGIWALLNEKERAILNECNEIMLDFTSLHTESIVFVNPHCVVIGYGELTDDFLALCIQKEHRLKLEMAHLLPQDFISLRGHLGDFTLTFKNTQGNAESLKTSQVVSFAPLEHLSNYKGVHTPDMYESADSMLEALLSLCGEHTYSHHIILNPQYCQYQGRRPLSNGECVCGHCVDICPTMGISSNAKSTLLELSAIDCIACGKCVSVCPTGSLEREGDGFISFTERARLYKGFIPLIVAQKDIEKIDFVNDFQQLRKHNPLILPFILQGPNMLNITYLLSLLQECSAPIILYSPLGEHIFKDIESLNTIYERIFAKVAIYDFATLQAPNTLQPIAHTHYIYTPTENESSKNIFSERLHFWVKQESYGEVALRNCATLKIDSKHCTLCLSCVEACNTNALMNNNASFELLYKPSLCTDCGYCVASCAENVLHLQSHTFNLAAQSFEYNVIASDEPFRCVECNKIFATQKSIEKIKQILAPAFSADSSKLRSLECCADCKVKVMFGGV